MEAEAEFFMSQDQIEAERVAFEAWAEFAHEENIHVARVALCTRNGQYVSAFTACLWQGWLARAELIHANQQAAEELIERQEPQRVAMEAKHARGE